MRKSFLCLLHSILAMSAHIDNDPETNPSDAETFYQRALALQSRIDLKLANVETGKLFSGIKNVVRLIDMQCKVCCS